MAKKRCNSERIESLLERLLHELRLLDATQKELKGVAEAAVDRVQLLQDATQKELKVHSTGDGVGLYRLRDATQKELKAS